MDLDDALRDLLPGGRSGDLYTDLLAAAAEAWRRRQANTDAGAPVIAALVDPRLGASSYRQIERLIGIPRATAQRWATPPAEADRDRQASGE